MAIDIANVKVPFLVGMRVLDVGLLIDNVVIAIVAWRYNREVVNGQAVSHIIIFEFDVNDIFIAGNNVSARQFMDDFYLLDPFRINCPDIIKVTLLPVNYHEDPLVILNADFGFQLIELHTRQQVHYIEYIGNALAMVFSDFKHIAFRLVLDQALGKHQLRERDLHDGVLPVLPHDVKEQAPEHKEYP